MADQENEIQRIEAQRKRGLARMMGHRKIALLTEGFSTPFLAKTAIGMLRYRGGDVVALIDSQHAGGKASDVLGAGDNVPVVGSIAEIPEVDAIYGGIAPPGGKCPETWRPIIMDGIERGIDIVSGLHDFLNDDPQYVQAARESGAALVDVRRNRFKQTATGRVDRFRGVRIHTVGHDCSIGKMVASLEISQGLERQGEQARFVATGQTGIMISGNGIPIDCVVADFVNGAAEELIRDGEEGQFLLVEGQGSISHPAFSAVTAGLLHGCAPDGLIFCYEAGRELVKGLESVVIPAMRQQVDAFLAMANLRHPCRLVGIAVNSRQLSADAAALEISRVEQEFGVPACDVYRHGSDKLVDACTALRDRLMQTEVEAGVE